jgi:hypothetical protein
VIDLALDFLRTQVNSYLSVKLDPPPSADAIILFNVSQLADGSGNGNNNTTTSNALISLVNVEEDRVSKMQENFQRRDPALAYKSPEIYLNLYVLFSVNLNSYSEALKRLSLIIQFFQHQNVFTPITHPDLAGTNIEKLIVDLYSLGFEQLNHMWSILGGKYLPSVMYKVRQITINEDVIVSEGGFIKEININENLKHPVTS